MSLVTFLVLFLALFLVPFGDAVYDDVMSLTAIHVGDSTCDPFPSNLTPPPNVDIFTNDDNVTFYVSNSFGHFLNTEGAVYAALSKASLRMSLRTKLTQILQDLNSVQDSVSGYLEQTEDHFNAMIHDATYRQGIVTDFFQQMEMKSTMSRKGLEKMGWVVFFRLSYFNYGVALLTLKHQSQTIQTLKKSLVESIDATSHRNQTLLLEKLNETYRLAALFSISISPFIDEKREELIAQLSITQECEKRCFLMLPRSQQIVHCANDLDGHTLIHYLRKLVNPLYLSSKGHTDTLDSLLQNISQLMSRENISSTSDLKRRTDWFVEDVEINRRIIELSFQFILSLRTTGVQMADQYMYHCLDEFQEKKKNWKEKLIIFEHEKLYGRDIIPLDADHFNQFYEHFQTVFAQLTQGRTLEDWFLSDEEWKTLQGQRKRTAKNRAKKLRRKLKKQMSKIVDTTMTLSKDSNEDFQEEADENCSEFGECDNRSEVEMGSSDMKVESCLIEENHENYEAEQYEAQFLKDREAKLQAKSKNLTFSSSINSADQMKQPTNVTLFTHLEKDDCHVVRAIYQGGNDIPWTQFVSFMNKLGAVIESSSYTAGSNKKFLWPGKEFPSMNFHKPHPKDKFQKYQLQAIKRRFMKTMGWGFEAFAKC